MVRSLALLAVQVQKVLIQMRRANREEDELSEGGQRIM